MVVEKKSQCKVQKLNSDRDFIQLKKRVHRAPRAIQKKLRSDAQVADLEFDSINGDFKRLKRLVKSLLRNCEKYSNGINCFVERSLALSRLFEYVLKSSAEWKMSQPAMSPTLAATEPTDGAKFLQFNSPGPLTSPLEPFMSPMPLNSSVSEFSSRHDVKRFRRRQEAIGGRIEADLKSMDISLHQPLAKMMQLFIQIGRVLKERELCILDLMSYASKYKRLSSKKHKRLTVRQARNKRRYARDLELEKLKYESLTTTIKVELQVLFKLFAKLLENWSLNFMLATYSIAFTLYSRLGCHAEVLEMISDHEEPFDSAKRQELPKAETLSLPSGFRMLPQSPTSAVNTGLLSIADIVSKFRSSFDPVTQHMSSFQVTRFDLLYSATLSSAKESAKANFRDSAVHGMVPTLYATAVYNYTETDTGYNDGDLAFHCGDLIKVVRKSESGWWYGESMRTKKRGYFPANYVEVSKFE
ncbi:LAME_0E08966g1_1 [Lachancea meyersii CBS 8951]|uniref:LAME_0E08966g1_1 n=1 Tax=Lachancea meyersii CBS 8951 TaxID=1266667 RepID=A0A1G4JJ80_9SACH|nr:LAME_0E08966g1_1 [Lachancea meyersii CBS 8951]